MSVKFNLGDKAWDYELRFDFNELADAEELAHCNLLATIATWPNLSCQQMRALLYALLKPTQPKLLLSDAGELLTQDMPTVYRAIKEALRDAELLVEEEPKPPVKPAPSIEQAAPAPAAE